MSAPAVSVLMAVRNLERWLPYAIDSLRAQTRKDFEIVAVDDGSTDGTSELLRAATSDLTLRIVRTEGVGLGAARNLAVNVASAPLLAVLDGDDMWLPHYVERVVSRLESDPDVAIVSPELLIAVEEEITDDRYYADGYPLRWFDDHQLEHLAEMNFIVPLSTFRREIIETVGGYDPTRGAIEDWDLWIRALQAGFRAGHISEPCGVYRFRTGSLTTDRANLLKGRIAVLERLAASEGPAAKRAQASLEFQQMQLDIVEGKEALRTGQLAEARSRFMRVARHSGAGPKQRAGALAVAAVPQFGRAVMARRASKPPAPRSVRDFRRERE
jgi:glycosyltransferase involved in cell wall biosynthesis